MNNSNGTSKEYRRSNGRSIKSRAVFHWLSRHIALEIAIVLALVIAAVFIGWHLLDTSVPADGDVRSHIFKIELLQSHLSQFSWPQWNPYWYQGIPEDQFYPPGFYFISAILSFIVGSGVVAYKIMIFLTMALNGLAIYYFARRILKFDSHLAIWCLIIYQTSTPMLINVMYGEGPNLLGWVVTVIFLSVYLGRIMEGKIHSPANIILPGFLLGAGVLIHPFPIIFAAMVIAIFHVSWLVHRRHEWKTFVRYHLPYIAGVAAVGMLIGMYYWLPAILTLHYSSPIYSILYFQWPGGTIYILAIIVLALFVVILTRYKIRGDPALDTLIISFILASALGFGATKYLPFGLGSLVQEFRFAAIIVPFLGIVLIFVPLKYRLFHLKTTRLAISLALGFFLTVLIFGLNQREALASGYKALTEVNLLALLQLLYRQFTSNFPNFAVMVFPYLVVFIFLALSLRKSRVVGQSRPIYIVTAGACLLLLASFVPYFNTAGSVNLKRLYQYVDNYEQPAYAQIMTSIQDGRLIVPMDKGFLTEGDNPVTFGRRWDVETDNGPYNQGDPKFFKFSVHVEWEDRWFNYDWTRENLMQESASKYIFIRGTNSLPSNIKGMTMKVNNEYGKLLELKQSVAYADKVTPILLDVNSSRDVTEFFNILLPGGYRLVLVDIQDISPELIGRFEYVMTDSALKISNYSGKTIFLLNDSTSPSVNKSQKIITLNMPYLNYTNKIFYHGDIADGYMWLGWNNWSGSKITRSMQSVLIQSGDLMASYLDELDYTPAGYKLDGTRIDLDTAPGFTLVKGSYFPYWRSESAAVMPTSQGFMLVNSGSDEVVLHYQIPAYYIAAIIITILGLTAALAALLMIAIFRGRRKSSSLS